MKNIMLKCLYLFFIKDLTNNILIIITTKVYTAKLGKNRFVECPEDDLISWNSTRCNGCQNSVSNLQRYLCCSCRKGQRISGGYIDFCSLCIDKMCKDKKEKERLEKTANEIIDNFGNFLNDYSIKVEHHHDKHIYLMMPFQVVGGGYDEF